MVPSTIGMSNKCRCRRDAARNCTSEDGGGGVTDFDDRERAAEPEDLGRLFLERANAGDVDSVAALYEPDAVVASAGGDLVKGAEAIRGMYEALPADPAQFAGDVRPALRRAISL